MVIKCWLHSAAICLFSVALQPSLLEPTLRFQQLDWERPTTERKQVRLGNFLLIHIYWWPHGWAGAHQGVGGLIFFFPPKFSETQGPNSTPTHISHFWYVWACLPVIPDQRVRWLGRAVILSILGQEEHPPTFTKIENSYISGFFFHIAEQISTCYFLVVYLSLHTNWTLHRVYANNLLSFITWAF